MGSEMDFLKEAEEIQKRMLQIQNELSQSVIVGIGGGGMIKIHMRASDGHVDKFEISPECLESIDLLNDLLVAAVNDGLTKIENERIGRIKMVQQDMEQFFQKKS